MKELETIREKLASLGKKVYVVGGWCREKQFDLDYQGDVDLATDATPEEMKQVLLVVGEVGKKYGTLIVREGNNAYEITTFRKDIGYLNNRKPVEVHFTDSLELDSERRDFTFNAIYYDIEKNTFLDPQNGISDIKERKIRFIGDPKERIQEDALRILRFVRLKNKYQFSDAQSSYFSLLESHLHLLKNISIERIKEELDKILLLKNNTQALEDLMELGFFEMFLPEIFLLTKTPGGPPHHLEGNVWVHTLLTLKEANSMFEKGFLLPNSRGEIVLKYFSEKEKLDYLWMLLFHDISKYETYTVSENGNVHYYNHEYLGSKKFQVIAQRLKFSTASKKKIHYLIENHIRVFKVTQMRDLKAKKFMMETYFEDLLFVGIADNLGRVPPNSIIQESILQFYGKFLQELNDMEFYTGNDILNLYPGIEGGKIGEMLELKNDEILLGKTKKQS